MESFAPYLTVYLLGAATPVFFFRQLMHNLGHSEDEGGCVLDFLLFGIFMLLGLVLYSWLHVGLGW
ncbi:MAG: hypothetical protein ACPGWR_27000 [Ardenticatenaceae bacterium]